MNSAPHIIIFDGDCRLCATAVNYIIRRDPAKRFRFASMQEEAGRRLIEQHRGPNFDYGTLLLIKDRVCYERGDAMLEIFRDLPDCRCQFRMFQLTPRPLRNYLYSIIARNRYRFFGKQDDMEIPPDRFLD